MVPVCYIKVMISSARPSRPPILDSKDDSEAATRLQGTSRTGPANTPSFHDPASQDSSTGEQEKKPSFQCYRLNPDDDSLHITFRIQTLPDNSISSSSHLVELPNN